MRVVALFLALMLAACAKPTPYQPAVDRSGGYGETLIEPGRWRVTFTGNSVTPREEVETGILYRAAEITRREGGTWFLIVRDETETDRRYVATGFTPYPTLYGRYYRRGYGYGGFGSYDAQEIKRYRAIAEILVMRGPKPEDKADAYDAAGVIGAIGPTLRRPSSG